MSVKSDGCGKNNDCWALGPGLRYFEGHEPPLLVTLSGESDQDTVATLNDNAYMRFPGQIEMRVNGDAQDFDAVRRF